MTYKYEQYKYFINELNRNKIFDKRSNQFVTQDVEYSIYLILKVNILDSNKRKNTFILQ